LGLEEISPGQRTASAGLLLVPLGRGRGAVDNIVSAGKRIPANNMTKEILIVGEGMNRVDAFANLMKSQGYNVRTYGAANMNRPINPNLYGSKKSLDANWHWIEYHARKKQLPVYDIGRQPGRTTPSPYYDLEERSLLQWELLGDIAPINRINPGF
jgi:hypothetical protein